MSYELKEYIYPQMQRKRKYSLYSGKANQRPIKRARTATAIARSLVAQAPGLVRSAGNYGRYGASARAAGLQPELKYFDTELAFSFDNTLEVPATGQLCLIPQGDTESTRDGRIAWIKSIQISMFATCSPGATANMANYACMWLVLDTQANGAAAGATDVFTSATTALAMLNLNNSGRFRILKKWRIPFNGTAGVTTAYCSQVRQVDYYKKCNIKIDWSSTTGAITEIRSNNIFLMAGSAAQDDLVAVTGVARLRFQG